LRSRILVGLIAGAAGASIGGLISEVLVPYNSYIRMVNGVCTAVQPSDTNWALIVSLCVYGLIGACLGMVDGIVEGSTRKLVRGLLIGAVGGFVLGHLGSGIGHTLYTKLGGTTTAIESVNVLSFVQQIIARAANMATIGVCIGIGASLATGSTKRIWQGAVGGFLGGFIGGVLFDILGSFITPIQGTFSTAQCFDAGRPGRMVTYIAIGALTGFFIGLVEELFKQAWVKVLAGRNEGKDFILSKPMNILGREERCEVPLYGDMNVAVQHAAIRADGKRHVLIDAGTPGGTVVNGQKVGSSAEVLLRDGDMIQIGTHRILFREKATASKFARTPVDEPKARPGGAAVPMPSHLCPFCGAPKDASGNCLCSLAGSPGAPAGMAGPGPVGLPTTGSGPGGYDVGTAGGTYGAATTAVGGGNFVPGGATGTPQLIGLEGPYAGQVFPLQGPNMVLGREAGCDVVLSADSTVSRMHARLVNEGGALIVYDNGSSNGTFVNGLRVNAPVQLASGDVVQFGSSKFRLE
jgi:pSer/pThr/pTyr-binding forkhead associated (FHA) protein